MVEPVLVDAGDEWPLSVDHSLLFDQGCERQHLVEGHAPGLRDGHPVGADLAIEGVEHHSDERVRRDVGGDRVRRRREESLEGGALWQLEPGIVGQQGLGRARRLLIEVSDVHLERQRFELGRDLLEPKAFTKLDDDGRDGGVQQSFDELLRGHVPAQEKRPRLELRAELLLGDQEDEGSRIPEIAFRGKHFR